MNAFQSTSKNSSDVSSKSSWVVYGVIFSLKMLVLAKARYFDRKKEKERNKETRRDGEELRERRDREKSKEKKRQGKIKRKSVFAYVCA